MKYTFGITLHDGLTLIEQTIEAQTEKEARKKLWSITEDHIRDATESVELLDEQE